MTDQPIVVPILPAEDIRAAADAGDWARAAALIAGHDHAVRTAWIEPTDVATLAPAWRDLLERQEALVLELQQRRDAAGEAMARLQRERRAAHLYLGQSRRADAA